MNANNPDKGSGKVARVPGGKLNSVSQNSNCSEHMKHQQSFRLNALKVPSYDAVQVGEELDGSFDEHKDGEMSSGHQSDGEPD